MFNTNPSTEVTIGWHQQSGTNPVVHYGTVDQGTNYLAYTNTQTPARQVNYFGMDNRFARLTGLTPNTIYYFVIRDSGGTSQRFWFKTCPNVNTETLSFISGGDSRSGTTQRINSNRMVAKIRPHAVLFGGDLTDTPTNASVQEWLDNWQLATTSDGQMIPLVHSYGNHEQYGSGGASFMYDLFDTPYDVYYNVRFGGNLFSMYTLNGEVLPGHTIPNNTVRVAQRNWLLSTLSTDNSIWKAAQYHRPIAPHESGKGEGADEFNDWANYFYDYGVRLVMESDAHVVKLTQEVRPAMATASGGVNTWFTTAGIAVDKGITFIGEGSWGTIRTMNDGKPWTQAGGSFYQFAWILVDACKMEIRTIDTQNPTVIPEHAPGDYTSISPQLEAQVWKPTALPSGVRLITRCNPPDPDFTANQTSIFTGGTVNFTDLSTNNPTSWLWNFGDGNTSTAQNPSNIYTVAGVYTVTLTATNADGSATETKIGYITVSNPVPPVADFTVNNQTPSVGISVNFTDLSTANPTTWSWDFGDGNTSTLQNPSHSYSAAGTYTVTLTATSIYGNDTEIKIGYIVVSSGGTINVPVATGNDDAEEFRTTNAMYLTSTDLEIGNDAGTAQYMGVRFQNINIPQGAIITNAYIQFRCDEADDVTSQMNIYIAGEATDHSLQFTTANNNISARPLTATYTWPDGTIPGWVVNTLYNTPNISSLVQAIVNRPGWTSGNAMSYIFWSDLAETSERVADSYEGGYPARLIIDYTLPAAPVAAFNQNQTAICAGATVNFTDQSTNTPTTWLWNFGDGNTSTAQNPSHTYAIAGNYTVTLTATNAGGSNSRVQIDLINVSSNSTSPTINTLSGIYCPNTDITLSAAGGAAGTGSNIYWYDAPNGGGTLLGIGNSIVVTPTATTTYYARREGTCNETADDTETANLRGFVYAANNTSATNYCTDNAGWHHFYNGNNIILSLQGDLSGVTSMTATIYQNGTPYSNTTNPALCLTGSNPGDQFFEMQRSWNINYTGTLNGSYSLRYYYPTTERTDVETAAANWMSTYPACTYTYKYNPGNNGWFWFKNTGGNYVAPQYDGTMLTGGSNSSINGVNYSVINNITSFSGGSGGVGLEADPNLPIELLSFSGYYNNKTNVLDWKTASELNNDYFELERSFNGANDFVRLATIDGHGTTTTVQNYQYIDGQPLAGVNYYRLRQVDFDGTVSYSNIIAIEAPKDLLGYGFFPNPTNSEVFYQGYLEQDSPVDIEVLNTLGQVVITKSLQLTEGLQTVSIDLSDLVDGTYTVRVKQRQNGVEHSRQIVKIKY